MSQENVEIVRRFLSVDVDEALPYADPGIVWNPIEELPTQGHDAVRASLAHWRFAKHKTFSHTNLLMEYKTSKDSGMSDNCPSVSY